MYRIHDDLYQSPARVAKTHDFDVVFWMKASPPKAQFGKQIVIDFPVPDSEKGLEQDQIETLWSLVNSVKDKKILTVCQAGQNRSGLVSAMVLMARGLPVETAIGKVQAHNGALWNPGFQRQLHQIARSRTPSREDLKGFGPVHY